MSDPDRSMEADLSAWAKVIRLTTTGRRSRLERTATVGFLVQDDGSLLVAAAGSDTSWAANLRARPECVVELDGRHFGCRAELLHEADRASTISGLILKYGTPAERLGAGPAYRLVPVS